MHRVRSRLVALIAASLLVVGGLALGNRSSTVATSPSATSAHIEIANFVYAPARLVVNPGERVTVTNTDNVGHTVSAMNGTFVTRDLAKGQSVSFLAPRRPGVYGYYCAIHQFMQGVLVVR
jgi:plastocyanin